MDGTWEKWKWSPSVVRISEAAMQQAKSQFLQLEEDTRHWTRQIALTPLDAEAWRARSVVLRELGYPELAIGDAYKARLLYGEIDKGTQRGSDTLYIITQRFFERRLGDLDPETVAAMVTKSLPEFKASLARNRKTNEDGIIEALHDARATADIFRICERHESEVSVKNKAGAARELDDRKKHITSPQSLPKDKKPDTEMIWHLLNCGIVWNRLYPWINRNRDPKTVAGINKNLEGLPCIVKATGRGDGHQDDLGIFALKNMPKGFDIFSEVRPTCGMADPTRCHFCFNFLDDGSPLGSGCCYHNRECTNLDLHISSHHLHEKACNKDIVTLVHQYSGLPSSLPRSEATAKQVLYLKVLASIAAENAPDPLESSIMMQLNTRLRPQKEFLSLAEDYALPITFLQHINIDPFVDLRYDTWVLRTIAHRIWNAMSVAHFPDGWPLVRAWGSGNFFNRGGEPNVEIVPGDEIARVYRTLKDVKEGEELMIEL